MTMVGILIPLLILVPLLGGAAGIVLFVVGLVKKKPALWGSGIALAVVSLMVVVVGVVAAGFLTFRSSARATQTMVARASAAGQNDSFRNCTGLDLPAGTRIVASHKVTYAPPASQSCYFLKLRTSPAFETLLEEHFHDAAWRNVRKTLTAEPTASIELWTPADLRDKAYYTRTHRDRPGAPDRMETIVARDPNTSVAYVVSIQQWDE